jgi:hypothetical protein
VVESVTSGFILHCLKLNKQIFITNYPWNLIENQSCQFLYGENNVIIVKKEGNCAVFANSVFTRIFYHGLKMGVLNEFSLGL